MKEKALHKLIVSRNKLIEQLIVSLPHNESEFRLALRLRDAVFALDKEIYSKGENDGH